MTDKDITRLGDVLYKIGQIEGFCDSNWVTEYCDDISKYIVELFTKRENESITFKVNSRTVDLNERREP